MNQDSNLNQLFQNLGFGLGLRKNHYKDVLEGRSSVSWFEVVTENFMRSGGRPFSILENVRSHYPIALHGVSLSVGSVDPIQIEYLKGLKKLIDQIEPSIISDHLCWTSFNGENLHDLLPIPFTQDALLHVVDRIKKIQDFLGKRILIENVSSYLTYADSEMPEWEFLSEVATRSDCGILLDINNVYVSSVNHQFDALLYLRSLPKNRIGQIHLAGHSTIQSSSGKKYLIDTHDQPICNEVWNLYKASTRFYGPVSTMVEWDDHIPELKVLEAELDLAKKIQKGEWNDQAQPLGYSKSLSFGHQSALSKKSKLSQCS